jgi:hypothetical protein
VNEFHVIELKDGDNGFKLVGTIERVPRQHSGWQSVTYNGQRFQLHGGIRNPEFINIKHPILGRD